jgi:hypothetical protein
MLLAHELYTCLLQAARALLLLLELLQQQPASVRAAASSKPRFAPRQSAASSAARSKAGEAERRIADAVAEDISDLANQLKYSASEVSDHPAAAYTAISQHTRFAQIWRLVCNFIVRSPRVYMMIHMKLAMMHRMQQSRVLTRNN